MKWILCLVLLLIRFLLIAQNGWAPNGSKWYYNNSYESNTKLLVRFSKDTLINSQPWKILEVNRITYVNNNCITKIIGNEFTYKRNDSVLIFKYGKPNLLYDFGANIGDLWKIPGSYACSNDSFGYFRIEEKGIIKVGSDSSRYLVIKSISSSNYSYDSDTIIENIGSLGYLLPNPNINCGIVDLGLGGVLTCYNDSTDIGYCREQNSCDNYTSLKTSSSGNFIINTTISDNILNITFNKSIGFLNLSVINILGVSIYSSFIESYEGKTLNIRLNRGLYILSLNTVVGSIVNKIKL